MPVLMSLSTGIDYIGVAIPLFFVGDDMSKESYKTDGGYGASSKDAERGYSNEDVKEHEQSESWMNEWQEKQDHKNIGFGRDTGNAR